MIASAGVVFGDGDKVDHNNIVPILVFMIVPILFRNVAMIAIGILCQ